MSNVFLLHPPKHPISHVVRIGHTGHKILENLYTAGRAPISRAVVDAGHSLHQKELIATLSNSGVEIILDTKAAELASIAGIHSKAGQLPWANANRPHNPTDWAGHEGVKLARAVADFAIGSGINTVLSPAHLIKNTASQWLVTDLHTTHNLRHALDQRGGDNIRIDYHLMLPIGLLKEIDQLQVVLQRLRSVPVDNVWLRVSGYGMDGSPAGTKRFIEAAWALSKFNKPLIADQVGGLVGLALAAFGAVGGICQGVAEKENFQVSGWNRAPGPGGSSEKRIYLPQLDMFLYKSKAEIFMAGRNAKSLVTCNDRTCCQKPEDMFDQSQAHALTQSARAIEHLNNQPELKRIDHLLGEIIPETGRNLRKARKIKISDEKLTRRIAKKSDRLDLMYQTLERLNSDLESVPIALSPISNVNPVKKAG